MAFVEKFRAKAQTAARAQSKLKSAEEMQDELRALKDKLQRLEGFSYNLNFRFRLAGAGGKFPVSLKDLSFKYSAESDEILKNITFDIKRGQRVAIMGDNGTGKTTLLNVIAERLAPTQGEVAKGHAVETGYFGQHQLDELSLEDTVLDNLKSRAIGVSYEELRGWLGAFGFATQDDIEKKAKVLSGGERARLALLRILLTRINLVLLDEPTNHLDVETKDLLKQSIRDFEGTTILVSHDREFVEDIAERILYLSHDHTLTDHLGDLQSFFEKYPQYVRHLEGKAKPSQAPIAHQEAAASSSKPQLSFEERKKVKNQVKSLERKISAVEVELEKLGQEKGELEKTVASAAFSGSATEEKNRVYERLSHVESLLRSGMSDWEKWASDLETLRPLLNN
jgi:ATP-binding cassette subfamily F protein 3